MQNILKKNFHESLITGILLSLVGGILDAHTFLFRNGIFANTQTGNIVLLALFFKTEKVKRTIQCVFSILAFIFGVFLTEFMKTKIKKIEKINYVYITLLIEFILLFLIGWIPKDCDNTLVIVVISFVCSLQTNVFRSLNGSVYSTTMCTGNLRSAIANFSEYVLKKDSSKKKVFIKYLIIILSFLFGAALGRFLTNIMKNFTLFVASFFILITLLFLILQKKLTKKN